jgi:gas vesicle protein
MASNDNGSSFALGFVLGGIIGAMVGILIAPKSGSETRSELADRSEGLRTRAEELAATLRDRTSPAVAGVRERVGPAVEGVRERVEQVSSRIGRADRVPEVDGGPIDAPGPIDDTTEETDKAPA